MLPNHSIKHELFLHSKDLFNIKTGQLCENLKIQINFKNLKLLSVRQFTNLLRKINGFAE